MKEEKILRDFSEELDYGEDILTPEDREKAQDSIFRRFRKGILNKLGKIGAIMVMITVPNVMKGAEITKGSDQPLKAKDVMKMSVSAEELGSFQQTGVTSEINKFLTESSPEELEVLKLAQPDNVAVIDSQDNEPGKVELDFTGGQDENLESREVIEGDADNFQLQGTFLWGEKDFSKTELKKMEKETIKNNIAKVLDQEFEQYQDWQIDLNTAIDKIQINGAAFSSPEGDLFSPEANVKLSQSRAKLIKEIVSELLQTKYNIDNDKVDLQIEGHGSQGDVLDFAHSLENAGYKFKNQKDNDQKRAETEKLIRLMNTGQFDKALEKIDNGGANLNAEQLNKIFEQDIASKRSYDLDINIFDKDVVVKTAKDIAQEKIQTPPSSPPEPTAQISQARNEVVKSFVQEFATAKPKRTIDSYLIVPGELDESVDFQESQEFELSSALAGGRDLEKEFAAIKKDRKKIKQGKFSHYKMVELKKSAPILPDKNLLQKMEADQQKKLQAILKSDSSEKMAEELKAYRQEIPVYRQLEKVKREQQQILKDQIAVPGAVRAVLKKNVPRNVAERRVGRHFKKQIGAKKRIKI